MILDALLLKSCSKAALAPLRWDLEMSYQVVSKMFLFVFFWYPPPSGGRLHMSLSRVLWVLHTFGVFCDVGGP